MASIIDAVQETFEDDNSVLKIIIYSIPLFFCVDFYMKGNITGWVLFLMLITNLLLFGFLLKCTQNVRNGLNCIMPSFNIFSVLWTGTKGLAALGPLIIASYALGFFLIELCNKYFTDPMILKIFICLICAICASIIYTGCILYAQRFKIADAYNFKLISKYSIDILIHVIFMNIKLFLINLIIILPIGYLIWLFVGITHPIAIFLWCMLGVFNLGVTGHYFAQIDYETIEVNERDDFI